MCEDVEMDEFNIKVEKHEKPVSPPDSKQFKVLLKWLKSKGAQANLVEDMERMYDREVHNKDQKKTTDPWKLLQQLGVAIDILVQEFACAGLTINFGKDKSAIMAKLFGKGARKCRLAHLLTAGKEQFIPLRAARWRSSTTSSTLERCCRMRAGTSLTLARRLPRHSRPMLPWRSPSWAT